MDEYFIIVLQILSIVYYNEFMETLIALFLIGMGIWTVVSPKGAFNFKAKILKSWGVTVSASPRAYKVFRYLGIAIFVIGVLLYFG